MHDYVEAARKQHDFVMCLWSDKKFRAYHGERGEKEKEKIDGILGRCRDLNRWTRMKILNESLSIHFKVVHGLCSREDFPLSAYLLLIQAMRNDINKGINFERGRFGVVLGVGARREIADMIRPRFNMDGKDPSGRKVGLLDRHHLMAFIVDPYSHEWRGRFELQTSKAELVSKMIALYVPLDEDRSLATHIRVKKDFEVSFLSFCL